MSKAGISKVDITPPLGIDFIGYHRPYGIQNIDEKIYATALVFENGGSKAVLVSVDNIGMLVEDTNCIRQRIATALNVTVEQVMVVFSHTHSGPATASDHERVRSYKEGLIEKAVRAALDANEEMHPTTIGWNVTNGNIGVNRREKTSGGKVKMGTNPEGAVDDRIGILSLNHPYSGAYQAIIVFCTAHPNVLMADSHRLSADYPGRSREILEKEFGGHAIIVQGAAGNINARFRGSDEAVEKMADELSKHVIKMVNDINYQPIFNLKMKSINHTMELKPIPEAILPMADRAAAEWGVNTDKWTTSMLQMKREGIERLTIPLEIHSLQINEGSFTGIPMEPFSESSIRIKNHFKNELIFFGGYTNGYLGYLPIKAAYPYGGYEVELNPVVYGPLTSLWMPPEESTAEIVVDKVIKLHEGKRRMIHD
ncbi:neutral/alkaline non-lysosomal ceramidase N-terminal domain-containing protein [Rossellomorea sp. NS-SX7]|uniref:neutral/alkaline non-lysosomal ceramidase N-terminal domain-containing protein n=1 Tax=Rossellomorea sp. NS-SX7 TaxID=3463856 RepID=UPI004057F904